MEAAYYPAAITKLTSSTRILCTEMVPHLMVILVLIIWLNLRLFKVWSNSKLYSINYHWYE